MLNKRSHWPISILSSLSSIVNMLLPLVLVRLLTPSEIGEFKIFFLYVMISPAFSLVLGLKSGLAFWAGREKQGENAICISGQIILITAIVFFVVCLLFHGQISSFFNLSDRNATIFAFAIFGGIASLFFEEAAIATGHIWKGALFYSGFELTRTTAVIITAFHFRDLSSALLVHTGMQILKSLVGYYWGHKIGLFSFTLHKETIKPVLKYAFPVASAGVFGVFVESTDKMILSTYISNAAFAFYSIGCLIIPPLLILEQSVTRVLIPQMSDAFSRNNDERAAVLYLKSVEQLAALLIPSVAGLILFSVPIIELLFTKQYASTSSYLRVFALSYLFLIIPYDSVPRAKGQGKWILKTAISFSIISLSLVFLLVRLFGPMGALAGTLLTRTSMRIYAIFYIKHDTGWNINRFLPVNSIIRFFLISITLSILMLFLKPVFANNLIWFLICGPLFAFIYLYLAICWKHKNDRCNWPTYKVLLLTQGLGLGGLEKMVLNLSTELNMKNIWQPFVFTFDHTKNASYPDLIQSFIDIGIPVEVYIKSRRFSFAVVFRLVRNIFKNNIQVLHTHDLGALIYGVLAKIFSLNRVRLVHTQHSFVHLKREKRYRLYERFFTMFVDVLTVVSSDTKKQYEEIGIPENKVQVIPNGAVFPAAPIIDRNVKIKLRNELADDVLKKHLSSFWILYMARLHPVKGHPHALKLWNLLTPEIQNKSVLIFVGPEAVSGELNKLKLEISNSNNSDRLHYFGSTKHPQKWLAVCDVFLSCSEFEGMPLGPLEALGSGLPVFLSNIPGHKILEHATPQYPLSDPAQGAKKLSKMIRLQESFSFSDYQDLWDKSLWIRESFSLQGMCDKYSLAYKET